MSGHTERFLRYWQDPVMRERMLTGCAKAAEASRNRPQRVKAEIVIRVRRTRELKRLGELITLR